MHFRPGHSRHIPRNEGPNCKISGGGGWLQQLLPPPAWEPTDDPENLAGLDADALDLLRRRATPQPLRTATDPVRRTGGEQPQAALVACTFPVEVARSMIDQGHPLFALLAGAQLHGLPTGHWPMFSEPKRLAEILDAIGRGAGA